MARTGRLLTEAQWKKIAPLLPKSPKHRWGGRPWIENRRVLEGILWILRSGARWQDLPEKYPHSSALKTALDSREDFRLVGEFPPSGRPLRPLAHDLSSVFPYRLLHDRLTEGYATASSFFTVKRGRRRFSKVLPAFALRLKTSRAVKWLISNGTFPNFGRDQDAQRGFEIVLE